MVTKTKTVQRYYAGLTLEKDLRMCEIYDELEKNADVIILDHGRNVLVHEMKYVNNSSNREDTGKTHTGFDFHYIVFYYKGHVYSVEPATYYPFTDENCPGLFNWIRYDIIDGWSKTQASYSMPYNGIESLSAAASKPRNYGDPKQPLSGYYGPKKEFEAILDEQGGYREREIYERGHICYEIINTKEHHVIRCACTEREADGIRKYFEIDVLQKKITG